MGEAGALRLQGMEQAAQVVVVLFLAFEGVRLWLPTTPSIENAT